MKYLQSISPFQIITALAQRNQPTAKKQNLQKTTLSETQNAEIACSYEEAEQFILQIRLTVTEQLERENAVKRKISIFQKIEIEPHYLQDTSSKKLVEFEFHLGSDAFLERTEALYQQISQINKATKEILNGKGEVIQQYFIQMETNYQKVNDLILKVKQKRQMLAIIRERKEYQIKRLINKKNRIKEKLHLLRNVKTKNEAAFLEINNIDQAFATEQSRVKLYRKLSKLTQLNRSKYVATIRDKLISTCKSNKVLIEDGLKAWISGKLNEKQIQKLAFMIYFLEKEDIYRDHQIRMDYSLVDRIKLKEQIKKIFSWQNFHYIKDASTRQRIHEFLHFLINRIQ